MLKHLSRCKNCALLVVLMVWGVIPILSVLNFGVDVYGQNHIPNPPTTDSEKYPSFTDLETESNNHVKTNQSLLSWNPALFNRKPSIGDHKHREHDKDSRQDSNSLPVLNSQGTRKDLIKSKDQFKRYEIQVDKEILQIDAGAFKKDVFGVWLSESPDHPVRISFEGSHPNLAFEPNELIFHQDNYAVKHSVTVYAINDQVQLSSSDGIKIIAHDVRLGKGSVDADHDGIVLRTISIEIDERADDEPGLVYELETFRIEEGEEDSDFYVGLKTKPSGPVTVTVTVIENTEDLSLENIGTKEVILNFPPNPTDRHWNDLKMVTVIAGNDLDTDDDDGKIKLVASGGGYDGQDEVVNVTITDNISAPGFPVVSFDKEESWFPDTRGGPHYIKVNIQPASTKRFQLKFDRSGDARWQTSDEDLIDYDIKEPIVVPANQGSMDMVVIVVGDGIDEPPEKAILTLQSTNDYAVGKPDVHILTIHDEEDQEEPEKPLVYFTSPSSSVDEDDVVHNVEVRIRPVASTDIVLEYDIGGNAQLISDYTVPSSVTLPANQESVNIPITIIDDDVSESDEAIIFTLSSSSEFNLGSEHHTVTIFDDNPEISVVNFVDSSQSVNEGDGDIFVLANINPSPSTGFTLRYSPTGDAVRGEDYTISNFVNVSANDTQIRIPISIIDDSDLEANETVILTLSEDSEYDIGNTFTHTLTILDNDTPVVEFTSSSESVLENVERHFIEVRIQPEPISGFTLNYSLSGTAVRFRDYGIPESVPVLAGQTNVEIPIVITNDTEDEEDETVIIMLDDSQGHRLGNNDVYTLIIRDDDDPRVDFLTSESEAPENIGVHNVVVSIQRASPVALTLNYSLSGSATRGKDYTIPEPVNVSAQMPFFNIPITIESDNESEGPETLIITLTDGVGYQGGIERGVHTLTIIDHDDGRPVIAIHEAEAEEGEEVIQLPVTLNPPSDQIVTVQYEDIEGSAKRGSDYIPSKGLIIFDPGATRGVIQISLSEDDNITEDEKRFAVNLLDAQGADISKEKGSAEATIIDDDIQTATIRIEDAVASENASFIIFQVHLSQPSMDPVFIQYRTEDGTAMAGEDYAPVSGVLDFASGTVEATITVPLLHDEMNWHEETFSVHIETSEPVTLNKSIAVATIRESKDQAPNVLRAYTARFIRTTSVQVVEALQQRLRPQPPACSAQNRSDTARLWDTASAWKPSLGELLAGCSVSNSISTQNNGSFSVWARGAYRQFQGRDRESLRINSDVTTGMLGADYRWNPRWMAGLLFSHHRGDGVFHLPQEAGEIHATLTGFYPYLSYRHPQWEIWLSGGFGQGNAQLNKNPKQDLTARFGALGLQGDLIAWKSAKIRYYGDLLATDAKVGSSEQRVDIYRVRIGLEGAFYISEVVQPFLEANVRQDGGNAETGLGMEIGGGVRVAVPQWQLRTELHSQRLVMHTSDGFTDWGVSGMLQIGNASRGFMATLRPSWGPSHGMTLYHQQTMLDASPLQEGHYRTELEMGYGIVWRDGIVRSIIGITDYPTGRQFRLGGQLRPWEQFSFSVSGLAYQQEASIGNFGVNMSGSIQY